MGTFLLVLIHGDFAIQFPSLVVLAVQVLTHISSLILHLFSSHPSLFPMNLKENI